MSYQKYSGKYEEIDDYSFLHNHTEEIIHLTDKNYLQDILKSRFNDKEYTDLYTNIISKEENNNIIIRGIGNLEYKVLWHNVNNITYLEIIGKNDKSIFRLCGQEFCKIDISKLDNILSPLIE